MRPEEDIPLPSDDDDGDLFKVYGDKEGYVIKDVASFLRELAVIAAEGTSIKYKAQELTRRLERARALVRVDTEVFEA